MSPFDDPFRDDVYRAEDEVLPDGGRRFTRFVQVERLVDDIVTSQWWSEVFPDAPIEVTVKRRSRGATFSAAAVDTAKDAACLWIRDGSWNLVTVLHELAHMASGGGSGKDPSGPHGSDFVSALCELWREYLGFHAFGALQSALETRGVPLRRDRRP